MGRRGTRYVYDSGEIWRLTDRQYRRFLKASVQRMTSVCQYGKLVGVAFNITKVTRDDFRNEIANLGLVDLANERTSKEGK